MRIEEVVLRLWKVSMVEATDVAKCEVFHLTLKRALQAEMKLCVSCG